MKTRWAQAVALGLLLLRAASPLRAQEDERLKKALRVLDEYKAPGLEAELSGVCAHPTDPDRYYVLANAEPPYRYGQKPVLPVEHRGKLLTSDREGKVLAALSLGNEHFGGLVCTRDAFYAALTNAAEILRIDPATGKVLARFPTTSAVGGLAYDEDRGVLLAHMYVGYPHIAVIDPKTGAVLETLAADESTMGLVKAGGDLLATWASGWEPGSISELRILDPATGKVRARAALPQVHSVLAPATDGKGGPAFLSMVTVDSRTGEVVIRRYGYAGEKSGAP